MRPTLGPCAKVTVTCEIRCTDGTVVRGENLCANPQQECPRVPGEGYTKCRSICLQIGHAEQVAAAIVSGNGLRGESATISGHFYACADCLAALASVGVYRVACTMPVPDDMPDAVREGYENYLRSQGVRE